MNIFIMGAPGSGKGTVAARIKDDYNLNHISTGDIFRENIRNNTALGQEAQSYMDAGKLVPDDLTNRLVMDYLKNLTDPKNGYLLDGYPRTLAQAEAFEKLTNGTDQAVDVIVYMDVPYDILEKRVEGRRSCPKCGEIYNIYFKPTKVEGICDSCGAELVSRKDDNIDSLRVRLQEYENNTRPVINFYEGQDKVKYVDANRTPAEVWETVKTILD